MSQKKVKQMRRAIRKANHAQWAKYLTNVARWSLRDKLEVAWLTVFTPREYREKAKAEDEARERKAKRIKKKRKKNRGKK